MANVVKFGCLLAATAVALVAVLIWPGDVVFQAETARIARAPLYDMVSGEGVVASARASVAAPEYASRLLEVYVDKDQRVTAGQPLFRVDTSAMEAELSQTLAMKAAYLAGAAGIPERNAVSMSGEEDGPAGDGGAADGGASLDGAVAPGTLPAGGVDGLAALASGVPASGGLDGLAALASGVLTSGGLDAAGAATTSALPTLSGAQAVYATQCAALAQAMEARAGALAEAIARGTVRAAEDGRVLDVIARSGWLLAAGQGVLALDDGSLCAQVALSQRDGNRVKAGQRCVVSIGDSGLRLGGEVESVTAGAMDGLLTVKITLDATDSIQPAPLNIGDSVDVDILAGHAQDALVLPLRALAGSGEGVFVIQEGRAVYAPVRLGLTTREGCQVLAGLMEGEEVVLDPPDGMQHGDRVVALN